MHPNRLKYFRINILIALALVIIAILYSITCSGQTQLISEQISINGGMNAQFGGQSRVCRQLNIPYGTDYVIIRVTTGEVDRVGMPSLATTVARLAATDGASIFTIMEDIKVVTGAGVVDVSVWAHPECAQQYLNKEYVNCNPIKYYDRSNGVRFEFRAPTTAIPYYICLRNPETIYGVTVLLEATAYTQQQQIAPIIDNTTPTPTNNNSQYNFDKDKYKNRVWLR